MISRNITARVLETDSLFSAVPASPFPLSVAASLPRLFLPFFPDVGAFGVVLPPLLAEAGSYKDTQYYIRYAVPLARLIIENLQLASLFNDINFL